MCLYQTDVLRRKMIYLFPGAINSRLLSIISNAGLIWAGEDIYKKVAISPKAVVNAVLMQ